MRERVREREPLKQHRAGGVDEDEGDSAAGERRRHGALARRGSAFRGRGSLSRHARHDHLGPVAVLQQRDEVGERSVVGLDVQFAAPEPVADVESAKPSAAFMANIIAGKKARQRRDP